MSRPLRCAQVVPAPEPAVRRVLRGTDVWTRTLRALGYRLRGSDNPESVPGPAMRRRFDPDRRWSLRPAVTLIGPTPADPPAVEIGFARRPWSLSARLLVAPTGAGVLVTADMRLTGRGARSSSARAWALRWGTTLLGVVTVAAHDPVIVVAGAVLRDGKVLAARRARPAALAGRWEMPGGKVEPGEGEREALARELREELGIEVTVGERIGAAAPVGDGLELRPYLARWSSGEPAPAEADPAHDLVRWVDGTELAELDWLPGDEHFVAAVARLLTDGA